MTLITLIAGTTHTGKTALAQRLLERGLTEDMIRDIFWNNALRVLRSVQK